MKSSISIQQIIDEAAKHEKIAVQLRAIAESLAGLNPAVELVFRDDSGNGISNTVPQKITPVPITPQSATRLEAVMRVLKNAHPKPLSKSEIENAVKTLGYEITPETLSSYLSRNKGIFISPSRGLWKLNEPSNTLERDDPT